MKNQNVKKVITFSLSLVLVVVLAVEVFAQTTRKSPPKAATPSTTATDTTSTDASTTTGTAADTRTPTTTSTDVKSSLSDYKKATSAKRLDALKKVGNKMIDVRLKDLNNVKTRLVKIKCLTDADRTAMTDDLNTTIDGLNAQKTKVDAATTVDELKPLVQGIRTDFRVYMVIIPKEHGLIGVCRAEAAKKRFDDLTLKIQAELNKAKNAGKDVTTAQKLLDDYQLQLEEAGRQTGTAREKFTALKVANGDQTNKELRTTGRTALKDAHEALKKAKQLLGEIRTELEKLTPDTTTPTSTP